MLRRTRSIWTVAALMSGVALAGLANAQEATPQPQQNEQDQAQPAQQRDEATPQPAEPGTQRNADRPQPANQDPAQADRQNAGQARGQGQFGGQGGISDEQLIGLLLLENHGEVQLSEFAQQQATSSQVQQFANRMAQEHARVIQDLHRALSGQGPQGQGGQAQAGNARQQDFAQAGSQQQGQQGNRSQQGNQVQQGNQGRQQAQRGPGGGQQVSGQGGALGQPAPIPPQLLNRNPLIGLAADVSDRCLQTTQQELQKMQGPQFDEAFMHIQVAMHLKQLDTLEVFAQHASPQLQQMLQQTQQAVRQHLDDARGILAQVKQNGGRNTQQAQAGGQGFQQSQQYSAGYGPRGAYDAGAMQGSWGAPQSYGYGQQQFSQPYGWNGGYSAGYGWQGQSYPVYGQGWQCR